MADVDYTLRNQVSQVQNMVLQLDQSLSIVGQQVAIVGQEQQETRSEVAALRHDFLVFVKQAELAVNIQRAETRLGALQGRERAVPAGRSFGATQSGPMHAGRRVLVMGD